MVHTTTPVLMASIRQAVTTVNACHDALVIKMNAQSIAMRFNVGFFGVCHPCLRYGHKYNPSGLVPGCHARQAGPSKYSTWLAFMPTCI